jgi:hypothetical protein
MIKYRFDAEIWDEYTPIHYGRLSQDVISPANEGEIDRKYFYQSKNPSVHPIMAR